MIENVLKRSFSVFCCIGLAFVTGCSEDNTENPFNGENPPIEKFVITTDAIEHDEVTISITPPTNNSCYYARLYSDTKANLDHPDEDLLVNIIFSDDFKDFLYTDEQTFTYTGLIGHSHYRLLYFSYDEVAGKRTSPLYRSDRITTPEAPAEFEIEVKDVTGLSAGLTIVPPDETMTYYYWVTPYSDYVTLQEESNNLLHQNDFAWWNYWSSASEIPLKDAISKDLSTGTLSTNTDEFLQVLRWDTEYLLYAYGLDPDGNITVPMTKARFHTNKPTASDNTFEVEISKNEWIEEETAAGTIYGYEIEATVTPKNPDESYYVTIDQKAWYDWYFSENNKGPKDSQFIMHQILKNLGKTSKYLLDNTLKSGTQVFRPHVERQGKLYRPDTEYVVFVFGMSADGPTTDLYVIPFETGPRPITE